MRTVAYFLRVEPGSNLISIMEGTILRLSHTF